MLSLENLVGQKVIASIPLWNAASEKPLVIEIRGIESGGVWVKSEVVTQFWLNQSKRASHPTTPVFFLPFHQIEFLAVPSGETALSEKAFGLTT